jgi:hypothetical protein
LGREGGGQDETTVRLLGGGDSLVVSIRHSASPVCEYGPMGHQYPKREVLAKRLVPYA